MPKHGIRDLYVALAAGHILRTNNTVEDALENLRNINPFNILNLESETFCRNARIFQQPDSLGVFGALAGTMQIIDYNYGFDAGTLEAHPNGLALLSAAEKVSRLPAIDILKKGIVSGLSDATQDVSQIQAAADETAEQYPGLASIAKTVAKASGGKRELPDFAALVDMTEEEAREAEARLLESEERELSVSEDDYVEISDAEETEQPAREQTLVVDGRKMSFGGATKAVPSRSQDTRGL